MPYDVNWLIKNEIIYIRFWGIGSEDELREVFTIITNMRSESSRNAVHTLTDTSGVTQVLAFQKSIKVVREFRNPERMGWEVVVGNLNKILELSLKISRSLLGAKSISFKTIQEALEHLKKEDSTLSWDKLNQEVLNRTNIQ